MFQYIPEIMRKDELVDRFRITATVFNGFSGCQRTKIRSIELRIGIAALGDPRDLFEFLDYNFRRGIQGMMVFIIELVPGKILIAPDPRRDERSGTGYDRL